MAANPHDDYESLAKLLYPSIEASGNVYYGQTRKLTIDTLFNKNNFGFESHIESERLADSTADYGFTYSAKYCWKLGPFHGMFDYAPDKDYDVYYAKYKIVLEDSTHLLSLPPLSSGSFPIYERDAKVEYEDLYFNYGRVPGSNTEYWDGRNFYVIKDGNDYFLYIAVKQNHTQDHLPEWCEDGLMIELDPSCTGEKVLLFHGYGNAAHIIGYKVKKENESEWTDFPTADAIFLNPGEKVAIKSTESRPIFSNDDYVTFEEWSSVKTAKIRVYGDIKALAYKGNASNGHDFDYHCLFKDYTLLLKAPNISGNSTIGISRYDNTFAGCTNLTESPVLPATELSDGCYEGMFYECTSLKKTPKLPATTLKRRCYRYMFTFCTSLEIAYDLPATVPEGECYEWMFDGCRSLVKAPDIAIKKTASQCCGCMFKYCTNLNSVSIGVTQIDDNDNAFYGTWITGIASHGDFYSVEGVEFPQGSGCPAGWVQHVYPRPKEQPESSDYIRDTMITSGSNSDSNGRGSVTDKSTAFSMLKSNPFLDGSVQPNTYNEDGSYNQDIWGYKCFNSPVSFRNGIYGEFGSLTSFDSSDITDAYSEPKGGIELACRDDNESRESVLRQHYDTYTENAEEFKKISFELDARYNDEHSGIAAWTNESGNNGCVYIAACASSLINPTNGPRIELKSLTVNSNAYTVAKIAADNIYLNGIVHADHVEGVIDNARKLAYNSEQSGVRLEATGTGVTAYSSIIPDSSNTHDLGSVQGYWNNLYVNNVATSKIYNDGSASNDKNIYILASPNSSSVDDLDNLNDGCIGTLIKVQNFDNQNQTTGIYDSKGYCHITSVEDTSTYNGLVCTSSIHVSPDSALLASRIIANNEHDGDDLEGYIKVNAYKTTDEYVDTRIDLLAGKSIITSDRIELDASDGVIDISAWDLAISSPEEITITTDNMTINSADDYIDFRIDNSDVIIYKTQDSTSYKLNTIIDGVGNNKTIHNTQSKSVSHSGNYTGFSSYTASVSLSMYNGSSISYDDNVLDSYFNNLNILDTGNNRIAYFPNASGVLTVSGTGRMGDNSAAANTDCSMASLFSSQGAYVSECVSSATKDKAFAAITTSYNNTKTSYISLESRSNGTYININSSDYIEIYGRYLHINSNEISVGESNELKIEPSIMYCAYDDSYSLGDSDHRFSEGWFKSITAEAVTTRYCTVSELTCDCIEIGNNSSDNKFYGAMDDLHGSPGIIVLTDPVYTKVQCYLLHYLASNVTIAPTIKRLCRRNNDYYAVVAYGNYTAYVFSGTNQDGIASSRASVYDIVPVTNSVYSGVRALVETMSETSGSFTYTQYGYTNKWSVSNGTSSNPEGDLLPTQGGGYIEIDYGGSYFKHEDICCFGFDDGEYALVRAYDGHNDDAEPKVVYLFNRSSSSCTISGGVLKFKPYDAFNVSNVFNNTTLNNYFGISTVDRIVNVKKIRDETYVVSCVVNENTNNVGIRNLIITKYSSMYKLSYISLNSSTDLRAPYSLHNFYKSSVVYKQSDLIYYFNIIPVTGMYKIYYDNFVELLGDCNSLANEFWRDYCEP